MATSFSDGAKVKPAVPKLINVRDLVPEIPGRTYATHGVDKYPAKMVPHLARYAIMQISSAGETVFDPFCGCGTVLVEARLTGRRGIGIDVNPVAVLLAQVKTLTFDVVKFMGVAASVVQSATRMPSKAVPSDPEWLSFWFTQGTLGKLRQLRRAIWRNQTISSRYRDLLLACLVISVRQCSIADPRSPKPFISKRARATRVGKHFDAYKIFMLTVKKFCSAATDLKELMPRAAIAPHAFRGDARQISRAMIGSIDAVVTSPPYLSAQDYYRSSKLELAISGLWETGMTEILGKDIIGSGRGGLFRLAQMRSRSRRHIGVTVPKLSFRSHAIVADYLHDMRTMLRRLHGCLRVGGSCCLIIGDSTIEGTYLPVHRWFIELARTAGFHLDRHEIDLIRDRRVPPKREGHASVIDREHLLFLSK